MLLTSLVALLACTSPGQKSDDSGGSDTSIATPQGCTLRITDEADQDHYDEWTYDVDGDLTALDRCQGESSVDGAGCSGERLAYEPAGYLQSVGFINWREDAVSSTFTNAWDGDTLVHSGYDDVSFEYGGDGGQVTAITGGPSGDETFTWGAGDELASWERAGGDAPANTASTWQDGRLKTHIETRYGLSTSATFSFGSDGTPSGQVVDELNSGGSPESHTEYTYTYADGSLVSVVEDRVEYDPEFGDTETTSELTYEYEGTDLVRYGDTGGHNVVTGDCPRSPMAWSPGDDIRAPLLRFTRYDDVLRKGDADGGAFYLSPWYLAPWW